MTAAYQIFGIGRVNCAVGNPATGAAQETTGWRVDYKRPDGVLWCHVFPDGTLGWRAAEYGIDLNDAETLLSVVLQEQHIQISPDDPTFLYNTDEETARLRHLARVVESQRLISYADPHGLLKQICDHHRATISPADHAEKTATVQALRAQRRKETGRG